MDLERLILFLVLTIAPLFNLLYRAWQQREERNESEGAAAPPPMPVEVKPAPPVRPAGRPRGPVRRQLARAAAPAGAQAAAPRAVTRRRTRMNAPLRRAIVLRELLGPCRGLEPYEPR